LIGLIKIFLKRSKIKQGQSVTSLLNLYNVNFIKSNVFGLINRLLPPIPLLAKLTGQKIIFPFYHSVSNRNLPHISHLYPLRTENLFNKDLNFFLKHYKSIDLNEVLELMAGQKTQGTCFHLTFDDGLREVYEVIAPLLRAKGIAATFFLNPDFIDNKTLFYRHQVSLLIEALHTRKYSPLTLKQIRSYFKEGKPMDIKSLLLSISYHNKNILPKIAKVLDIDFDEYLKSSRPYMTTSEINELIKQGFTVGAHSMNHPLYRELPLQEQISQTETSINYIESEFKPTHKAFAFPFTDDGISKEFFEVIFNEGNKIADLTFGTAGLKKDIVSRNVQRIPMENSLEEARTIITGEYLYYLCKFPLGRNTLKRL
jgi:peptidoglycan/xylan/chitin deacetylase (PgdA/CDA1 family)